MVEKVMSFRPFYWLIISVLNSLLKADSIWLLLKSYSTRMLGEAFKVFNVRKGDYDYFPIINLLYLM